MEPQSRKASFAAFGIVLVVFGALLEVVRSSGLSNTSSRRVIGATRRPWRRITVSAFRSPLSACMSETAAAVNLWELESREEPLKSVL